MELLFELLLEFAVEMLFGVLAGLFSADLDDRLSRTMSTLAVLLLLGAGLGWASTVVFPQPFISDARLRLGWLIVSPAVGGAAIAGFRVLIGDPFRWKKFLAGACFVGMLELARFVALGLG